MAAVFPLLPEGVSWHNPAEVSPDILEFKDGWRPLLSSELNTPKHRRDCEFWRESSGTWVNCWHRDDLFSDKYVTYRVRENVPIYAYSHAPMAWPDRWDGGVSHTEPEFKSPKELKKTAKEKREDAKKADARESFPGRRPWIKLDFDAEDKDKESSS